MSNGISVLLLDGELDLSLSMLRCLGQIPQVKVHVLSKEPWAPIRFSRYCASFHVEDNTGDDKQKLELIRAIVKKTGARIILPADVPAMRFLSAHCDDIAQFALPIPVSSADAIDLVSDKWKLAAFLEENHLPSPPTRLCMHGHALELALQDLPFPVLLKPVDGVCGEGILFFEDRNSLLGHISSNPVRWSGYIVQSYIQGYDIDCSVLCVKGEILSYTTQRGLLSPLQKFTPPHMIEFREEEQLLDVVARLMSALKWSGVAHVDLRYDEQTGQFRIIEVNPRFWASILGSLFAGVNFPYLSCLAAMGASFQKPAFRPVQFIWRHWTAILYWLQEHRALQGNFLRESTSWKYVTADPLPETFYIVRRVYRALHRRLKRVLPNKGHGMSVGGTLPKSHAHTGSPAGR